MCYVCRRRTFWCTRNFNQIRMRTPTSTSISSVWCVGGAKLMKRRRLASRRRAALLLKRYIVMSVFHQNQPQQSHSFRYVFSLYNNFTELELGTQSVVEMDEHQTILQSPSSIDKIDRWVRGFGIPYETGVQNIYNYNTKQKKLISKPGGF